MFGNGTTLCSSQKININYNRNKKMTVEKNLMAFEFCLIPIQKNFVSFQNDRFENVIPNYIKKGLSSATKLYP